VVLVQWLLIFLGVLIGFTLHELISDDATDRDVSDSFRRGYQQGYHHGLCEGGENE